MPELEKLVRDRIPASITAEGTPHAVRRLDPDEYASRLDDKLDEEVAEYHESAEISELVDVVEVIQAIVERRGLTWDEFEALRQRKRDTNGGFTQRLLLTLPPS